MGSDKKPVYLRINELQNKELSTDDQILAKELKKAEIWMKSIRDKTNRNWGYIHTIKEIAEKLQVCERTIRNMINEDLSKDILKRQFDLYKEGNKYLFQKDSLYKFISKNSYKYENGKKFDNVKCHRLPEYLTIDDCAEMLGLKDGRQFRRKYIDRKQENLEDVEILIIKHGRKTTVRIEKASFELWIKSEGEKAK